jgi:hypothetical protein
MHIYQTGGYRVKASAVDKVKRAVKDFVHYVQENEPGTKMYLAWQQRAIRLGFCTSLFSSMRPRKPAMANQRP